MQVFSRYSSSRQAAFWAANQQVDCAASFESKWSNILVTQGCAISDREQQAGTSPLCSACLESVMASGYDHRQQILSAVCQRQACRQMVHTQHQRYSQQGQSPHSSPCVPGIDILGCHNPHVCHWHTQTSHTGDTVHDARWQNPTVWSCS